MRPMKQVAIAFGALCVLAGLLALSGSLRAQSAGAVHACANPGNGILRLVGASEACWPNEERVLLGGSGGGLGSVTGQLEACGETRDFKGVLVHIPGRAFSAFLGSDGGFQIDNVPPGTYDIAVESGGVTLATVPGVMVGAQMVPLGSVIVETSSDPDNCGACGVNCGGGACLDGVCQAPPPFCEPGETRPCYSGPAGTAGVGICSPGVETCAADGTSFGACIGQVTPEDEVCGDNLDNNCDGQVDEGCATPGGCLTASDCTGADGVCQENVCVAGSCEVAMKSAGTVCAGPSCQDGTETAGAFCDGAGTCVAGPTTSCSPFVCGANACLTSCTTDANCVDGHFCTADLTCAAKLPAGGVCTANSNCLSGNCVSGVCQ